jgi:hypothetical protein
MREPGLREITITEGTLSVVTGEVWLEGWTQLLQPVQAAAEAPAQRARQSADQRWVPGSGAG